MVFAYLSMFLSQRYLPGLTCMCEQFARLGVQHPLVVVYNDYTVDVLPRECTTAHRYVRLSALESRLHQNATRTTSRRLFQREEFGRVLQKILAWVLEDYSRVFLIDLDIFVNKNLDHIFHIAPARDILANAACDPLTFNTGMVMLRPSVSVARALASIRVTDRRCELKRADQSLLNRAFPQWTPLPLLVHTAHWTARRTRQNFSAHDAVHFVGEPKPWERFEACPRSWR